MSDIGAMVEELIAAGTPPAVAARVVAEAFSAGVMSAPTRRQSADETADRRRERDRIYRAEKRAALKKSADNLPMSSDSSDNADTALTHKTISKPKKVRAAKIPCPPDWQPNEHHFEKAKELHIPESAVLSKAEDMRLWAASTGANKADWDATFHGFLRRDVDRLRVLPKSAPPTSPAIPNDLAIRMFKQSGRWHPDYGPEPGKPGCRASPEDLAKYGYGEAA